MVPDTIRSEVDRHLSVQLLQDQHIQRIQAAMEEHQSSQTRRSLLARALRLSPSISPKECEIVDHCCSVLDVETEVELYVYSGSEMNAGCTQPEDGRVFILVSSSLLESFEHDELCFVVGHELGHHIYSHHSIPLSFLLAHHQNLPPQLVLLAHRWQRHAEVSADRAGIACVGRLDPVARAFFKLSSGLRSAPGPAQIQAFIDQAEELYQVDQETEGSDRTRHQDWLSSHPFAPVRLRTAQAFIQSEVITLGGRSMSEVEATVEEIMQLMEPSYLEEDSPSAENMRRLLFAAAIVVADSSGVVSTEERQALADLLGCAAVPITLDAERLAEVLPERIELVKTSVPMGRRVLLVRDLTLIARADGHIQPSEIKVIEKIASDLDVSPEIVWTTFEGSTELD